MLGALNFSHPCILVMLLVDPVASQIIKPTRWHDMQLSPNSCEKCHQNSAPNLERSISLSMFEIYTSVTYSLILGYSS